MATVGLRPPLLRARVSRGFLHHTTQASSVFAPRPASLPHEAQPNPQGDGTAEEELHVPLQGDTSAESAGESMPGMSGEEEATTGTPGDESAGQAAMEGTGDGSTQGAWPASGTEMDEAMQVTTTTEEATGGASGSVAPKSKTDLLREELAILESEAQEHAKRARRVQARLTQATQAASASQTAPKAPTKRKLSTNEEAEVKQLLEPVEVPAMVKEAQAVLAEAVLPPELEPHKARYLTPPSDKKLLINTIRDEHLLRLRTILDWEAQGDEDPGITITSLADQERQFYGFATDAILPWEQLRLAEVGRDGPSDTYETALAAMTALVVQATTALNSLYVQREHWKERSKHFAGLYIAENQTSRAQTLNFKREVINRQRVMRRLAAAQETLQKMTEQKSGKMSDPKPPAFDVKLDRNHIDSWLNRMNWHFDFEKVPEDQKVRRATTFIKWKEGGRLIQEWVDREVRVSGRQFLPWALFVDFLQKRFRNDEELTKVLASLTPGVYKQTAVESTRDYYHRISMDLATIQNGLPASALLPANATKVFVDGLYNATLQERCRYEVADTMKPFVNLDAAAMKAIRLVEENPALYREPRKRDYPTASEDKQAWRKERKARRGQGNEGKKGKADGVRREQQPKHQPRQQPQGPRQDTHTGGLKKHRSNFKKKGTGGGPVKKVTFNVANLKKPATAKCDHCWHGDHVAAACNLKDRSTADMAPFRARNVAAQQRRSKRSENA